MVLRCSVQRVFSTEPCAETEQMERHYDNSGALEVRGLTRDDAYAWLYDCEATLREQTEFLVPQCSLRAAEYKKLVFVVMFTGGKFKLGHRSFRANCHVAATVRPKGWFKQFGFIYFSFLKSTVAQIIRTERGETSQDS